MDPFNTHLRQLQEAWQTMDEANMTKLYHGVPHHRVAAVERDGKLKASAEAPVQAPEAPRDISPDTQELFDLMFDDELKEMPAKDNDLLDYMDDNPIDKPKAFKYDHEVPLTNEVTLGIKKFKTTDGYKIDFIDSEKGRTFGQVFVDPFKAREFDENGNQVNKTYVTIPNIKISKAYQGKGIGYAFYKWLIKKFPGADGLLSDKSLTKKGKRGTFWVWDKLSKEFDVYAVLDGGDRFLTWKGPLANVNSRFGKGHGNTRFGIKR